MKIAVIRFSALGDIAATLPIVRAFKIKPTIITSTIGYELLKDEFEDIIVLKDKKPLSIIKVILEIRKRNFSHIFDFQCNDRTKLILSFIRAKIYHSRGMYIPDEDNIFLAIAKQSDILNPIDMDFTKKNASYIVLNCGSSPKWMSKRIPIHKWQEFSEILYEKYRLPFYLTGDSSELSYIKEIAKNLQGEVKIVAGKTSILELKDILTNAFLTISTDSAAMHISAVQKTPTIGIFGATNWIRSAPFGPWTTAVYDKKLYKDAKPLKANTQVVGNYYDGLDIRDGLKDLESYL